MKLIFIFISLCLFSLAQVNDSTLYQLRQIQNDTERINQLYQTGFDIRNADPEMAFKFAEACNKEALKTHSKIHLAKSYNLLGILFYKKANYTEALENQIQSLKLNTEANNLYGVAINQANLGNIYSEISQPKMAEYSYLQSLQASNKTDNKLQITRCLINLGALKHEQKQYDAALKQFAEALSFANIIGEQNLAASCYNNMGVILKDINKPDSALLYFEEGLKIKLLMDNEVELADSYINIAGVYLMQKNYNQAENYINLANDICTKYDYPEALIEVYKTKWELYEAQEDYKLAINYLKKYYFLKDSLNEIEVEIRNKVSENKQQINQNIESSKNNNSAIIFAIIFLIMLVGIPIFLIRYKR